ncbi:nuclear transport factor 2 family protein [Dactylosporangium sp. AC04546]|uniref:YybH family protein n=1 Tax=Dactylosporangium sp. AC04546 TaxID=2862460 RepID=UPI002E7BF452|nr:nuclear transport factor 2 family protein [Dactylosporangium sp. AC04546]WVK84874.1 nuclear transport factor 2 family protein [Dactylosporangium sp. AC04546]
MSDPVEMVDRLGAAFLAQDVEAVLACFVPDDDITYVGSESGESATGRDGVRALLTKLFERPEAYSWQATAATIHALPGAAFVIAEADGTAHASDGTVERFPYRVTGLLSRRSSGAWLWRAVQGAEPA